MALPPGYPLPPGWKEQYTFCGRRYYLKACSFFSESTWVDPHGPLSDAAPLPPGWEHRTDRSHRWFFFHNHNRIITYEDPRWPMSRYSAAVQVRRGNTPSDLWRYGEIPPAGPVSPIGCSDITQAEQVIDPGTPQPGSRSDDDTVSTEGLIEEFLNAGIGDLFDAIENGLTLATEPEPNGIQAASQVNLRSIDNQVAPRPQSQSDDDSLSTNDDDDTPSTERLIEDVLNAEDSDLYNASDGEPTSQNEPGSIGNQATSQVTLETFGNQVTPKSKINSTVNPEPGCHEDSLDDSPNQEQSVKSPSAGLSTPTHSTPTSELDLRIPGFASGSSAISAPSSGDTIPTLSQSQSQSAPQILLVEVEQHVAGVNDLMTGALNPANTEVNPANIEIKITNTGLDPTNTEPPQTADAQWQKAKSKAQQKREKKARQNLEKTKQRATAPPPGSLAHWDKRSQKKAAEQLTRPLVKPPAPPSTPPIPTAKPSMKSPAPYLLSVPAAKPPVKPSGPSLSLVSTTKPPAPCLSSIPTAKPPLKPQGPSPSPVSTTKAPAPSLLSTPTAKPVIKLPAPSLLPIPTAKPLVKPPVKSWVKRRAPPQLPVLTVTPPVKSPAPYLLSMPTAKPLENPPSPSLLPGVWANSTSSYTQGFLKDTGRSIRHRRSDPLPSPTPFPIPDLPMGQVSDTLPSDDTRYWLIEFDDGVGPYDYYVWRSSRESPTGGRSRMVKMQPIAYPWLLWSQLGGVREGPDSRVVDRWGQE